MRAFVLLPMLLAAACSGGGEEPANKTDEAATAAPAAIRGGQWQVEHEVVSLTQRDKAAPQINTPKGTKSTTSICVSEADAKKPQPALFLTEGYECNYRDSYLSGGRINANLSCKREGLQGDISAVVNGKSTAETLEGTTVVETRLVTDGDVRVETKFSGRRAGECTPEAAGAAKQ